MSILDDPRWCDTANPIDEAIFTYWGERCEEYDADCIVCKAWRKLDALRAKVDAANWMRDALGEAVRVLGLPAATIVEADDAICDGYAALISYGAAGEPVTAYKEAGE